MEDDDKTDSGDLILRQPEHIVHQILSHLDFSDLVRTSILSKSWRYLWIASSPELIFDSHFFNVDSCGHDFDKRYAKREQLMYFAEQTLRHRHQTVAVAISLECLVMNVRISNPRVADSLDRCIRYATGCDVKHLELKIRSLEDELYVLPPTLFAHKSLTVLNLSGCRLDSNSCTNMNLSCLKMMYLWIICIDSVQILENVIASCPVIEYLNLAHCFGFSKGALKITGIVNPKLAVVEISCCKFERIEIEAPGLQSFLLRQDAHCASCVIDVSACINMRELRLYNASTITDKSLDDLLSKLSHLEMLIVSNCNMVETVKISSCRLKSLEVCSCKNLVKVEVDDPNLSLFSYTGENVISFSSNAMGLSINISLYPSYVDTLWYAKLVELLGRFNAAKVLTLYTESHKSVIVPRELRESLLPPLYNVEHLILELDEEPSSQAIEEIIDGLLWLSPHPATLSIASFSNERTLELAFLYNKMEANSCYCFSLPITCWQHCSKEVKIKSSGKAADEVKRIIKSFLEHAKISKKIYGMRIKDTG